MYMYMHVCMCICMDVSTYEIYLACQYVCMHVRVNGFALLFRYEFSYA